MAWFIPIKNKEGGLFLPSDYTSEQEQFQHQSNLISIHWNRGDGPVSFNVDGVDHAVGFVIAPEGQTEQGHHIPEAYLSKTITDGEIAASQEVTLGAGEYVYFCPLNLTPQYPITVD